jgi:ABC-type branched-subunit amino acid transport system permease subunit
MSTKPACADAAGTIAAVMAGIAGGLLAQTTETVSLEVLGFQRSAEGLIMLVLGAFYAQIYRYRYVSTPTERQQTKWVVFGILLWLVLMGILFVPYSIELSLPAGSPLPWWTLVSGIGWWLTLT